jgi:hypothetical protein
MHSVLIIGDFNADLLRNKRFDIYLNNIIVNNLMVIVSPSLDSSQFSYEKGDYSAMLDHCISSNYDMVDYSCSLVDNVINLSDHIPLKVIISWFSNCFDIDNRISISHDIDGFKNIISIPPNFDNDEIKEKFNTILMNNINFNMNHTIEDINNKQNIIDNILIVFLIVFSIDIINVLYCYLYYTVTCTILLLVLYCYLYYTVTW